MGNVIAKYVDNQLYQYELFDLISPYEPILKQKLEPFDFNNPPMDPLILANSLVETMNKAGGIGLSANQVGLPYRVFVMGNGKESFACFNPEIVEYGLEEKGEEGCLTYPGLFLPIPRAKYVKVKYQNIKGEVMELEFNGLTARVFQHELDHLDGVDYTKRVSPIIFERQKRKMKSNVKKIKKQIKAFELMQKIESGVDRMPEIKLRNPTPTPIPQEKTFTYTTS